MNNAFWGYLLLGVLFILVGTVGFCFGFEPDKKKRALGLITFVVSWSLAFSIFTLTVFMCQNCAHLPIKNIFTDYDYCYHCGEYLHLPDL